MIENYRQSLPWLLFFFFTFAIQGQEKSFTVNYISEPISLDGSLDENVWQTAESATEFYQYFPTDSILANQQSDIKMLYDDTTLYVGITVYTAGNDYVVPSLQRDFRAGGSDNITLMFDTFNDGTNAFLFGTNPLGVRREALVSNGGTTLSGFTTSWDVKWKGETKIYDNYYVKAAHGCKFRKTNLFSIWLLWEIWYLKRDWENQEHHLR